MALKQAGLIFRAETANNITIAPRSGEAFRVRRIFVTNPSVVNQFVTIINDTARVGFFRCSGYGGAHLLNPRNREPIAGVRGSNMLDWMSANANFTGYPVVQGEAFTLSLPTGITADFFLVADSYDSGDVKSTEQGGSKSTDVLYVNYGTNASIISATGYNKLDGSKNPAEMVGFPFGLPGAGLLPSGKKAHIYFIGGQPTGRFVSAGNTAQTNYIRPRTGSAPAQTIFDRGDVGIPFIGTIPGAGVDFTSTRSGLGSSPDEFAPSDDVLSDLDFNGNDEFSLQVLSTIVGTGQLNAGDIDVWCLLRIFSAT